MRIRTITWAIALLVATGCAKGAGRDRPEDPEAVLPIERVIADPARYDDQPVRIRGYYLSSFETSVLTDKLAESYPPQAGQPSIWVVAPAPEGPCLEQSSGDVAAASWGPVVAEGSFLYQAEGGFGHLGAYTMTLEDASLNCA